VLVGNIPNTQNGLKWGNGAVIRVEERKRSKVVERLRKMYGNGQNLYLKKQKCMKKMLKIMVCNAYHPPKVERKENFKKQASNFK
jgi:hypothetical protein